MTHEEWLACDDWRPMIELLAGKSSERKHTLYVCAGLRCVWDALYSDSSRQAVEIAELAADGKATKDQIDDAKYGAESPTFGHDFEPIPVRRYVGNGNYDAGVRRLLAMKVYTEADLQGEQWLGGSPAALRLQNAAHIAYHCLYLIEERLDEHLLEHLTKQPDWPGGALVREVFGNPFRHFTADPRWLSWNNGTIPAIARGIYDDRAFDRMPILADALEESGCPATEMIVHCRQSNGHVRGCWAIDALLELE
jgi:hypothetical protein